MSSRCKTLAGVVNLVDTCNKVRLAAMQVLCNAMGHGKKSNFQKKTIMQVCNSTLLASRAVGGCQISWKKHCVTLEWPSIHTLRNTLRVTLPRWMNEKATLT